jgi:hypothetical protein
MINPTIEEDFQSIRLRENEESDTVEPATIKKAKTILSQLLIETKPAMSPCQDGSIDLYWNMPAFVLLINVPAEQKEIDFYTEKPAGENGKQSYSTTDEALVEYLNKWLGESNV